MSVTITMVTAVLITASPERKASGPSEPPFPASTRAAQPEVDRAAWVERIKGLKTHKQAAFAVGPQLMELDPAAALAIFRKAWPLVTREEVKTGMLKAFAFGRHPHVLLVLHAGATDESAKVRNHAYSYLANYAFRDFSDDPDGYAAWHKEFAGKPVETVLQSNCRWFVSQLAKAQGAEREQLACRLPYMDLGSGSNKTSYISKRKYFVEAGIMDVLERWLSDPDAGSDVRRGAFHAISCIGADEAVYRKLVLPFAKQDDYDLRFSAILALGAPGNTWAVDPLLEMLSTESDISTIFIIARALGEIGDASAIPGMIAIMKADNAAAMTYAIGHYGLRPLTGVKHDDTHDGEWWSRWWAENRKRYSEDVRGLEVSDWERLADTRRRRAARREQDEAAADVADVPAQNLTVPGNEKMRYFLIGPRKDAKVPSEGFKLVVVLPGGGGGEEFHPFVKRVFKNSMPDDYLIAQPVAFKWTAKQEIVWPTGNTKVSGQQFSTEDFVEAVVKDVRSRHEPNDRHIFTLTWSSSGPAAYAISLAENSSITGSFIAMSVFKPGLLPPLDRAKGHSYYLYHSPEDRVCPFSMATTARDMLMRKGAQVRLKKYEGGHGWAGSGVFQAIAEGIRWLEDNTDKRPRNR